MQYTPVNQHILVEVVAQPADSLIVIPDAAVRNDKPNVRILSIDPTPCERYNPQQFPVGSHCIVIEGSIMYLTKTPDGYGTGLVHYSNILSLVQDKALPFS